MMKEYKSKQFLDGLIVPSVKLTRKGISFKLKIWGFALCLT
jgi:hypothetical protein